MRPRERIRVLLVEDDEDDCLIITDLLASIRGARFELIWARSVADGLSALVGGTDVCLLDHNLGAQTGLDFLTAARRLGVTTPIVMLTGDDDPETDSKAIGAGAADYLLKRGLEPWFLERTLLRSIRRAEALDDRLRAETALRWSDEQYRRIVETMTDGVWVIDADSRTTFMNARMATLLGYRGGEVVGMLLGAFLDAEGQAKAAERLDAYRRGVAEEHELRYKRKDGSDLWARIRANPLFDADGRYEGVLAMVTDISERHDADELRARLAAIVESSDDAIVSRDLAGTITSWNRGAEQLYGYAAAEAVGRDAAMLALPGRRDAFEDSLARVGRGERVRSFETAHLHKDGSSVEVSHAISPIQDSEGRVIGSAAIARDLTEQRRVAEALRKSEAQLWQGQKLEAIGRLAGGVAHDFNNLLSVIMGYTCLIRDGLDPGSPLRADVDEVCRAGDRAAELTRQLLTFSRQQVIQPRVMNVNTSLRGMERMLRRILGEDIELTLLAAPALGMVNGDPGQIEQVIMNLAVNARDAMPRGGRLTLETADVVLDADFAAVHPETTPGPHIMLAITDTGEGMDAATRARIFEPFFTTKQQGRGTGLGLATVFGVVRQSGGTILVCSELGHGTSFKIYLPRTDAPLAVATGKSGEAVRGGQTETILLAEDEAQVRTIIRKILQRNGYTVLEASHGAEALEIAAHHVGGIDLLLTDVVMPRMSGPQLVALLKPMHRAMKVLYTSGYAEGSIVQHGVLDAEAALLPKPFTPEALLRKVREVLDAR